MEAVATAYLGRLATASFDSAYLAGVQLKNAELGRVICRLKIGKNLLNSYGTLHGGAIASLVDGISTCALVTTGRAAGVTVDLNVTYIAAAMFEEEIEIECSVLKAGKNIAMLSAELRRLTGELIAIGRHTKYLAPPKHASPSPSPSSKL